MILNHSEESLDQNAKMEDALVPIRLDMEIEGSFWFPSNRKSV